MQFNIHCSLVRNLVSESLDCLYQCLSEFPSQIGNVDIEFCILFENLVISSYLFDDLRPGDASVYPFEQIFEYLEFFERKLDLFAVFQDFLLIFLHAERLVLDDILLPVPFGYGLDPHIQLFEIERFDEIIICSIGESFQLIFKLASGGRHDDRKRRARFPYVLAQRDAIHAGKHEIQDDHVECMMLENLKSIESVFRSHDIMMFEFKISLDIVADGLVVFYDQYPHLCV